MSGHFPDPRYLGTRPVPASIPRFRRPEMGIGGQAVGGGPTAAPAFSQASTKRSGTKILGASLTNVVGQAAAGCAQISERRHVEEVRDPRSVHIGVALDLTGQPALVVAGVH